MQHDTTGGHDRDEAERQAARSPGADGKFFTTVDDATIKFADPTPTGKHILEKAKHLPPEDHVLVQLLGRGTRSVGLDETVDLRAPGTEAFRVFKSDRTFSFTLNGHGFEWGAGEIPEPELRAIGHVRKEEVLVLERDSEDIDLKPGDILDLTQAGTEHLYSEKHLITVFFEGEAKEIPRGVYTTERLKEFFGVQDGYVLEYLNAEGQITPLKPGEKLRIRQSMKFFEQVPCGGSS